MEEREIICSDYDSPEKMYLQFLVFFSKLFVFFCVSIKSQLITLRQWKSYYLEQS